MFVNGDARGLDGDAPTGGHVTVLRRANATSDAPLYRDVVYRSVWPGVDARVSAATGGLKYTFDVAPGGDPRRIHLRYSGADRIVLTSGGELKLQAGDTTVVDSKPVGSQQIGGRTIPVEVRFVQHGDEVTFAVGKYDRGSRLTIDPTLVYSTYLGSSGNDIGRAIAVDSTGAAYVAGSSNYFDLPVTPGAYQTTWHGDPNTIKPDAFIAKINPAGTHFDYVTYLGGTSPDEAIGIAVDTGGNAYVTGYTQSPDFPVTNGAYRTTLTSDDGQDGFLTKLNSTGSTLVYSTFLGANSRTVSNSVAVDASGNAYVAGGTESDNLPVSIGGQGLQGHAFFNSHGFLLKFSAAGDAVVYGTYIGGDSTGAGGVAVTGTGTAFVAGGTSSFDGIAGNTINGTNGHVVQDSLNGPAYRSNDGGQTFVNANARTNGSSAFAINPADPSTVYQGTLDTGVLKTIDGGAHWSVASSTLGANTRVFDLVVNPATPSTVLATASNNNAGGIFRSTDSGATWTQVSTTGGYLAFAPLTPSIVYSSTTGVLKSVDGGATWTRVFTAPSGVPVGNLAVDPSNASIVYVAYNFGQVLKTTNGGATWTTVTAGPGLSAMQAVAVDPTLTSVVWAGDAVGNLLRSTDGGTSWGQVTTAPALKGITRMVFDGGTLYVSEDDRSFDNFGTALNGIVKTSDRGATWSPLKIRGNALAIRGLAALNGLVYAGGDLKGDAFLWRVDTNDGAQAFKFGTYLGGASSDSAAAVAIDRTGNAVVAISTSSADVPTTISGPVTGTAVARVSPNGTSLVASSYVGSSAPLFYAPWAVGVDANNDAYVAIGDSGGSTLVHIDRIDPTGVDNASYVIGGTQSNVGALRNLPLGLATGPVAGDVYVTGFTTTTDFPTTAGAPQPFYGSGAGDAFIAKVSFGGATPPPPTNLALHRPAVASSEFGAQYAASFAVDGDVSTRWSSQFSDPQWIYVDLGQTYAISEVVLRWETAFGADYQVQVSNDASAWTTIRTVTGGDGGVDDLTGLSGTGRYVRIYGTRRGTEWGYSLWEFEVYGTPSSSPGGLPAPWTTQDVGTVGRAGSASYDNNRGVFTVAGSGADIWGTADAFRYVFRPLTGDGSIWVRVLSVQNTSPLAKAGIMFRDGTGANAAHVMLDVKPDGCAEFMKRDSAGATTTFLATGSQCGIPLLLQLVRTGSTFTANISTDQVNVQHLGSTTVSMPATANVGLIVSSHDDSSLNTAEFDNVMFTAAAPDRALNRPVVSSSDFSTTYAAANAVDGDASTRWSSQFSDPQWIYVDLGEPFAINQVKLSWETAYGADYQIQVSDDATNWTTVATTTGNTGGVNVLPVSGVGRYVRMYGTRRGTEWGYSLWSFEVYGDPAP